jgi:hypothetical protein
MGLIPWLQAYGIAPLNSDIGAIAKRRVVISGRIELILLLFSRKSRKKNLNHNSLCPLWLILFKKYLAKMNL